MITIRTDLSLLLFCLTLTPAIWRADEAYAKGKDRPNIVLVMCDDLGWGDVGFNGGQTIKTPHLDEMAQASMKFTRFYAASAVCSPTRGSVVTGRHPYRYGIPNANTGHMKPEEHTLAELLKKLGYATGHFGKWHLGTLTKTVKDANRGGPGGVAHFSPPSQNGFDVNFSTESKVPTYDPMLAPKSAGRKSWDFIRDKSAAEPYGTHYWNERGEIVTDNLAGDDSRIIMDRAAPFIQSAVKDNKPFFAVIWFHTPHLPVVAGPKHTAMYPDAPSSFFKNYYGCVTAMDEQIGRLRKTLRDAGVAENTIVTFCSDNGPEGNSNDPGSAGPFRGRKRDLFEGGVRVPGLVEWPARIKPGSTTDYPAVTSDYLPTILEIVGAKVPDARPIDGVSLLPVFDGKMDQRPSPIGFQIGGQVALSDNRYKIIKTGGAKPNANKKKNTAGDTSTDGYMLFDLIADQSETTDIADAHPDVVKRMAAYLQTWIASCTASSLGNDYD